METQSWEESLTKPSVKAYQPNYHPWTAKDLRQKFKFKLDQCPTTNLNPETTIFPAGELTSSVVFPRDSKVLDKSRTCV